MRISKNLKDDAQIILTNPESYKDVDCFVAHKFTQARTNGVPQLFMLSFNSGSKVLYYFNRWLNWYGGTYKDED